MPPRPRKRKVGLTRIDAALDAMASYGFPKKLVRETIKSLLKEYGGEEGYVFIEESSYSLLIETILEKLETNNGETICALPTAGPSSAAPSIGAPEPSCAGSETVNNVAGDLTGASEPSCMDPETVSTVAGDLIGASEPSYRDLETMNTASKIIKTGKDSVPQAEVGVALGGVCLDKGSVAAPKSGNLIPKSENVCLDTNSCTEQGHMTSNVGSGPEKINSITTAMRDVTSTENILHLGNSGAGAGRDHLRKVKNEKRDCKDRVSDLRVLNKRPINSTQADCHLPLLKAKQEPRGCVGNPVSSSPRTSSIGINCLPTTETATNSQLKSKRAPVTGQPCYGWIGSNEEDRQLVELPAVLPDQLCGLVHGTKMRAGKRPSRWDIGPTTRVCVSSPPLSTCVPTVLPDQLCGLVHGTEPQQAGKRPWRRDIEPTASVCDSRPPFSRF